MKWKSYMIYSLVCDEKFGFGVVLMQKFATVQTILTSTSDIKKTNLVILYRYDKGHKGIDRQSARMVYP